MEARGGVKGSTEGAGNSRLTKASLDQGKPDHKKVPNSKEFVSPYSTRRGSP